MAEITLLAGMPGHGTGGANQEQLAKIFWNFREFLLFRRAAG
jgi:hypothetical protein